MTPLLAEISKILRSYADTIDSLAANKAIRDEDIISHLRRMLTETLEALGEESLSQNATPKKSSNPAHSC